MEMNFYEELLQMREKYRSNPLDDIKLNRPQWLDATDPMSEIYENKSLLLQKGEIIYARIVQANSILFRSFPPFDCPAHIVYSTAPHTMDQPDLLEKIAWGIYSYKGQDIDSVPDEWKDLARVITDEYDRSDFSFSLNVNDKSAEYRMIPTMIYRKLLPKRKLCGSLLPVLAMPESKQVLIVPKQYWTKAFTKAWTKGII